MSDLGAFIAVILSGVIAALLGLMIVRRTVPHERLARHSDIAGYVYASILAQVVIAALEEYRDARAVADNEANAVLNLAQMGGTALPTGGWMVAA